MDKIRKIRICFRKSSGPAVFPYDCDVKRKNSITHKEPAKKLVQNCVLEVSSDNQWRFGRPDQLLTECTHFDLFLQKKKYVSAC